MAGEIFSLMARCCSFCSALSCEARELASIRLLAISLQSTRLFMTNPTAKPRTVINTTGRTQLGFLTMSSKVFPGEKKTPITRANGLREACASGAGTGVVAIEDSSTTRLRSTAFFRGTTHGHQGIFQWGGF